VAGYPVIPPILCLPGLKGENIMSNSILVQKIMTAARLGKWDYISRIAQTQSSPTSLDEPVHYPAPPLEDSGEPEESIPEDEEEDISDEEPADAPPKESDDKTQKLEKPEVSDLTQVSFQEWCSHRYNGISDFVEGALGWSLGKSVREAVISFLGQYIGSQKHTLPQWDKFLFSPKTKEHLRKRVEFWLKHAHLGKKHYINP
jgi:hypothetical protein